MKLNKNIQIEYYKMCHTFYNAYQMLCNVGIIFIMLGTFFFYKDKLEIERIRLFYDVAAVLLPILASISIALGLKVEEKIGNLYGMLFVKNRRKLLDAKILYSWGTGNLGIVLGSFAMLIFCDRENLKYLLLLLVGFLGFGIFLYAFHFLVNLKFGMGISIFFGIFEFLQGIIYSNIHLKGVFRFIPFSWIIQWGQNTLDVDVQNNGKFWGICVILIILFLYIIREWFQCWEGRKNYG